MRRTSLLAVALSAMLASTASLWSHPGHDHVKHHHVLLGRIVSVDPDKNEFTINTETDHAVVCFVDSKTVVKRDGRKIDLGEVRAGERARCHCAAIKGGKHYSQQLLLEGK